MCNSPPLVWCILAWFEETCALNLKALFFPFFLGTSFDFICVELSMPQLGGNGDCFCIFQQNDAQVRAQEVDDLLQSGNHSWSLLSGQILFSGGSYQKVLILSSFWYEREDTYFAERLVDLANGKVSRYLFLWNQGTVWIDICSLVLAFHASNDLQTMPLFMSVFYDIPTKERNVFFFIIGYLIFHQFWMRIP